MGVTRSTSNDEILQDDHSSWTLLQSVAWVSMIVRYSQRDSISAAISKTFDGKHPCALCQIVSEGKKSEQKEQRQISIRKIEIFCQDVAPFLFVAPDPVPIPCREETATGFILQPPKPPPRLA